MTYKGTLKHAFPWPMALDLHERGGLGMRTRWPESRPRAPPRDAFEIHHFYM